VRAEKQHKIDRLLNVKCVNTESL